MKEFLKKVAQFMLAVLVAPLIFIKNFIVIILGINLFCASKVAERVNNFTGSKCAVALGTLLLLPVIVPVGSIVGIVCGVILGIEETVDVMCEIYKGKHDIPSILKNITNCEKFWDIYESDEIETEPRYYETEPGYYAS